MVVRARGHFSRKPARLLDFNRFGAALKTEQPLAKDKQLFITLKHPEVILPGVVGVVHNCIRENDGYRCGIQFRTRSDLQLDKDRIESALARLERLLGADDPLGAMGDNAPGTSVGH